MSTVIPLVRLVSISALLLAPTALASQEVRPSTAGVPVRVRTQAERDLAELMNLSNDEAPFAVSIKTDTGKTGFIEGERFRLEILSDETCFITVLEEAPDGALSVVVPGNAGDTQAKLEKGATLVLPIGSEKDGRRFKAQPPHGTSRIKVFATSEPIEIPHGDAAKDEDAARERRIRELLEGLSAKAARGKARPAGSKGVGVTDGDPLDGDAWATAELLIVTGKDEAELAKNRGQDKLADLLIPEDKVRRERPAPAERPARRNPAAPLTAQTSTEANDRYRAQWESTVSAMSGSKSLGPKLVRPRGAQPTVPLAPVSDLIVVRSKAPGGAPGSKAIGRWTTELVPVAPPGSKALDASPEALAKRISALQAEDPSIVAIIPNRTWQVFGGPAPQDVKTARSPEFDPKSPFSGLQWHLNNSENNGFDIRYFQRAIDLIEIEPVTIGLVDQGVHLDESRLADCIWTNAGEIPDNNVDDDGNGYVDDVHGWNFASNSAKLSTGNDVFNHGTYCMSVMTGGAPGKPYHFFGVCHDPVVIPAACVAFDEKAGTAIGPINATFDAMKYAIDNGAKVLNLSLGGPTTANELFVMNLHPIWDYAEEKDVLVVIAAGNENQDIDVEPVAPACIPRDNTIVVMAVDPSGGPARGWNAATGAWQQYSNYGRNEVDIAAPGTMVLGIPNVDATSYDDGTSFATPIVAAAAAAIWAKHPDWKAADVKRAILETARVVDALEDKCLTGGMLDIDAAMNWSK
ncbi:MAG: S8 family serine peptidase [Phycisphaerae bacterium]|nr:S8 family serine peptidase [Phycisphaerae bacterium]